MAKKIKSYKKTPKLAKADLQIGNPKARAKIIAVATELFGENGLEGTTTRQIAAASGLNISLISYYFGGKIGLYKTIIYEHAVAFKGNLDSIFQSHRKEKFTAEIFRKETESIVRQMVEMRIKDDSIAKIFMAERTQKMPYAREVFETIISSTTEQMVQMIQKGQDQGFLKNDFPPAVFLIVMIESIFGYFMVQDCQLKMWNQSYQMAKDKEKFIQFITHVFTQGILI